jgi:hypothetical protein
LARSIERAPIHILGHIEFAHPVEYEYLKSAMGVALSKAGTGATTFYKLLGQVTETTVQLLNK